MEPFGILRMLQTLLPKEESQENEPPTADLSNSEKDTAAPAEPMSIPPQENACWQFMQAHDRRAKNIRKR